MILPILLLIVGLALLLVGGEYFVRGSASLAKRSKISPMVIGLTVVAFGTSAAELMVNVMAALKGTPDVAIGNILGSNIANILLILGIAAIIRPLTVKVDTIWKEIPLGVLAVLILFVLSADKLLGSGGDNMLSLADGLVLLGFFVIFLSYTYGLSKQESKKDDVRSYSWSLTILFVLFGLAGLVGGAKLLVDNGVILARMAGLSELFIGLTIIAVGTSLPELVASGIAAYRGHDELAVGNVAGSNIFNILFILGLTPLINPVPFNSAANGDVVITILAALLLFFFMFIGKRHQLQRWQGVFMVITYLAYITFITLRG
ncbi:MAG TPA: calcium/sodium antiporter [Patescibacteria group bacterium]|nr:calcium/sodium antiporter [Patescibacteria group bacterium]